MKNLNHILAFGTGAMLLLASCSTSYNAMRGGETDDLYFMASDAQIATEYAVSNNNPQNFQSLSTVSSDEFDQENFSARNVNPEYLAKYQTTTPDQEEGTVYFDESQRQDGEQGDPNINVYNNFYGAGVGLPGQGFNQSRFNLNLGFGMGMGGFGWGGPMMGGFGWGNPMMMGGFYDPFWDPFWGPRMGMGFGMRSGFGWGMGPRFGMGFGWGNPWMMGMGGFGWGNPMMMGMGGFGWGHPMMGGWGMGHGLGWGGRPMFVTPGYPGEAGRQIVRGARPGRGAGTAVGTSGLAASNYPATTRAARRDAASPATTTGRTGLTPSTSRNANRDFGTSQNEYVRQNSRIANTSARPSVRNTGSAAATRPSSRTGLNNARPAYGTTSRQNARSAYTAPSRANTNRSTMGTRSGRNTNPSYNRGTMGTQQQRMAPSRSMSPSRNQMSSPSRGSSPTMRSAPAGRSSGGGFSSGGGSRGGGGGMSSGGSRGGRGN